jgi:hypothetical protein
MRHCLQNCREHGCSIGKEELARLSGVQPGPYKDVLQTVSDTLDVGLLRLTFDQLGIRFGVEPAVPIAKGLFESFKVGFTPTPHQPSAMRVKR